ncbi:hypothetical protein D3C76_1594300 [compost metagenome]
MIDQLPEQLAVGLRLVHALCALRFKLGHLRLKFFEGGGGLVCRHAGDPVSGRPTIVALQAMCLQKERMIRPRVSMAFSAVAFQGLR